MTPLEGEKVCFCSEVFLFRKPRRGKKTGPYSYTTDFLVIDITLVYELSVRDFNHQNFSISFCLGKYFNILGTLLKQDS